MSRSVLLIGNFLSASGTSRGVCEELALRLTTTGWQVARASTLRPKLLRFADMILTTIRRRDQYDAAHVDVYSGRSFAWAECVSFLLKFLDKPFVLTLHGGNLPAFAKRWSGRVRRLLNSANVVTTPSRYLQGALRCYRSDLLLFPNAIDLIRYPVRLCANPKPKLVWLRAFHELYNPMMAIRVVELLAAEAPTVHLTMVGPDKGDGALQQVKAEITKLRLGDRVSLRGPVAKQQVPLALNSGDIFLNTTNADNTPVSVIEAMACGLCVVTTNVGGLPYLVRQECDGLLVPPNDAVAMGNAVKRVLSEPGLAARLSHNARAKAEQFDWSRILPQWEALFSEVITQHSADSPVKTFQA